MKRILTLTFILLALTINAIAQETENSCSHKALVRDFVSLADSLSRLINDTKASVSDIEWEKFTDAARNGEGEKSFEHLGTAGESVRTTFSELGIQLFAQKQKLYEAIKTDEEITDAEINEIVNKEIYCYFSDTIENNLPKLLAASGKLAPMEIGNMGPCDPFENCLRASAQAYYSAINNCISVGISGGGIFGWLGALFSGGGCVAIASNTHHNAVSQCFAKYYKACYGN